jgi:hypothetical protein
LPSSNEQRKNVPARVLGRVRFAEADRAITSILA